MLSPKPLLIIVVTVGLGACTSVPYTTAYPESINSSKKPVEIKDDIEDVMLDIGLKPVVLRRTLSADVLASLPADFQISNHTNSLTCLFDESGKIYFFGGQDSTIGITRNTHGSVFRNMVSGLKKADYRAFFPAGYPNTACFIPANTSEQVLDDAWFDDWSAFLILWQERELSLSRSLDNITAYSIAAGELMAKVGAVKKENIALSDSIESLKARQVELIQRNAALEDAIRNVPAGGGGVEMLTPQMAFNPQVPWSAERDPFMDVVNRNFEDISMKPWVLSSVPGVQPGQIPIKRMHPDLVRALDNLYELLQYPEKLSPAEQDILKETGFNLNKKINEAVRTPWIQAIRGYEKKKGSHAIGKNPVAEYLSGDHLFGLVADMNLSGTKYDIRTNTPEAIAAWNQVEKLLNAHGLYFSAGANDAVHIGLKPLLKNYIDRRSLGGEGNAFRAKILNQYRQAAIEDINMQKAGQRTLLVVASEQERQFSKLENDLNMALTERNALALNLSAIQASVAQFTQQNQALQAILSRKLQMAKRNSSSHGSGGRYGHGHGGAQNGSAGGEDGSSGQSGNTGGEISVGGGDYGCSGCDFGRLN